MIVDADGHFFETEEIFEKHMDPRLRPTFPPVFFLLAV